MADDRVYIRCKACGDKTTLMKFFSMSGMAAKDITSWIRDHGTHHPRTFYATLDGDPGFELFTESGDENDD